MHGHRIKIAITVIGLLGTLAACGYHFKGEGLKAPEGVATIAVIMLKNQTSESGIETVFTSDLSYEFTRSKVLRVVDAKKADAVLSGSVKSMGVQTISLTANYDSDERRVTMTLDLALTSSAGKVLWADRSLSDREEYKVVQDNKAATERNRREAIETISERLSEKVHNRILQGF